MALFKRTSKEEEVTNLEQYYEDQGRSRVLGPLLAFAAVICVALLVTGLFFGGRWAFTKLTDDNTPAEKVASVLDPPEQIQVNQKPSEVANGENSNTQDNSQSTKPSQGSSSSSQKADNQTNTQDTSKGETGAQKNPTFTSSTNTDQLPNNGPGGVLLAFLVASFVGYLAHLRHTARKQN